jgi:hypothetical protein
MLHCQWWKPCPYQGGISGNFNSYNYYNLDQPSLEDLVICQVKIKDNYSKKLSAYDKILGSVHAKLETLFSTMDCGKIPWQPEPTTENVNVFMACVGDPHLRLVMY